MGKILLVEGNRRSSPLKCLWLMPRIAVPSLLPCEQCKHHVPKTKRTNTDYFPTKSRKIGEKDSMTCS